MSRERSSEVPAATLYEVVRIQAPGKGTRESVLVAVVMHRDPAINITVEGNPGRRAVGFGISFMTGVFEVKS